MEAVSLKTILFDVDGTLIDTTDLIADGLGSTLETALGYRPVREELVALIGRPLIDQLRIYVDDARVPPLAEAFMTYYEERRSEKETLFPGALQMLQRSREAGLVVGLVTSKNRREIEGTLDLHRFGDLIDFVISSEDTPRPKPFPDPVLEALRRSASNPRDALFVGDSIYDMRSGAGAAVQTGGALWGPFGRSILEPEQPTYLFDNPEDVTRLVSMLLPITHPESTRTA